VNNDMAARERLEDAFSQKYPAPPALKEKLVRAWSIADAPTHRLMVSTNWPPRFMIDGFERCRSEGEDRG
jgi:hypothetical protein